MVSLHRRKFVVVHRCSSFPIDPKKIFPEGQIFTKNYHFWRFLEPYSHTHFKATMVKFGMRVRSWDSLPQAKFCKNDLREYTPLGKICTKNYHFWRFFGPYISPHLSSQNGKNLAWGANLGDPPHAKFCKNWLRRYTPFWQNYTKNSQFWLFWRL